MIYYVSDLHLGDKNVFDVCSRPFISLRNMEYEIIKRWNSKVLDNDIVYVLGDIIGQNYPQAIEIIKQLNGKKSFVVGNHDLIMLDAIQESGVFESIEYVSLIKDNEKTVCISHYPLMDWIDKDRGAYHVYGHIHNKTYKNGKEYAFIKKYYSDKPCFNCSVDVTNFEPVTLEEMMILKEKNKDEPYIN